MRTLSLLLLCSIVLFKATGQAGSLYPTFGYKGIQTTGFYNNLNTSIEQGSKVLTNASGDIFVVVLVSYSSTRIAKYLPDGRLDSSYGNAGYSNIASLRVTSATLQGDKIITAGSVNDAADFALARFTANGKIDSSFGVNGIVTTDFNNPSDEARSIALQGNKIIIAGYTSDYSNFDFALARYTADGTLDSSFGHNGLVTTDFDHQANVANSIAVQGNKIIAAGYTGDFDYDFALVRYTVDGSLDSTFGENGKVTTDFGSGVDVAISIALQEDKIIAAGTNGRYFALARYKADGALDYTFGDNGKVTTAFNNDNVAGSIALQGDKIIAAGYTHYFNYDFALARYTANGLLDSSFGENGKVITDFNGTDDAATSIVLQGDKIIAAGYTENSVNNNNDFGLARYTSNGISDSSFGVNGTLTGYFPTSHAYFTSTVIQGNKIIAAGYIFNINKDNDFALARYTAEGTLDSSFGVNGIVTTDFYFDDNQANAIALQGDKIIVAGSIGGYPNGDFALARYTADGSLDLSFGVNGLVHTDFNNSDDHATSIALQGDKIIAAGITYNPVNGSSDFGLARYNADGSLDPSFGVNGLVTTNFNINSVNGATSIALQGDKIIVAGSIYNNAANHNDIILARYTADGKLDSSFGENGIVTAGFNTNLDDEAHSITLQGDKIIVGGSNGYFALARYTTNGTLDSSFGENGLVVGPEGGASSLVLQGDKIIAGGSSNGDFVLARYTANGTLDASFGENGKVITNFNGAASVQGIALQQNRLYAVGILDSSAGSFGVVAAYQLEAPEPVISMSIDDVTVSESNKQAVVTVHLSAPATKWVGVRFTTRDKTALSPQDYQQVKGILLFAPGVTTAKACIPIVDDDQCEATEQFEVLLLKAHNAIIQDSVGVVTITDDDKALLTKQGTSLRINISPNPSADAFNIQLQGSNLKQPVSIRVYDISGRLLEERLNISIGQSFHLGDQYKAGTYIIEALQGNRSVQTKVIKTGQ